MLNSVLSVANFEHSLPLLLILFHRWYAMTEKRCTICLLEPIASYILIGERYFHIECFVALARREGPQPELRATLFELLAIHGF